LKSRTQQAALLFSAVVGAMICCGCCDPWARRAAAETQAREQAQAAEQTRIQTEEKKRHQARLDEQSRKIDALLLELSKARSDAEREAIREHLSAARAEYDRLKNGVTAPNSSKPPATTCAPGDPLCGL
jgi:hypothetical protein